MKKYLYLLLLPLALVWACKEKPELEPVPGTTTTGKIELKSEESVVLSDEGDIKQIAFSATLDWTASSSESWLTVTPGSGKAGDVTVTVSAGVNESYDPRTANVTLTSDKATKVIKVTQKQKGALLLTESTIPVEAEGKVITITAKANSNVTAAIGQEAQSWIADVTTKGLIDYIFQFEIAPNAD